MAKKKAYGSMSAAVRELLEKNPKMKASEVVATLAAQGIAVKPSLVYFTKGRMKRKTGRRKKQEAGIVQGSANGSGDPLAAIMKIKKLAGELGGLNKLKALVAALTE